MVFGYRRPCCPGSYSANKCTAVSIELNPAPIKGIQDLERARFVHRPTQDIARPNTDGGGFEWGNRPIRRIGMTLSIVNLLPFCQRRPHCPAR